MFPFQWNSRNWPAQQPQQLDPAWGPMFTTASMATPMVQIPQGQFCGNGPMNQQQSQAQSQAQINALHQQNALLNQQIQTQYMIHLHHLQQLASHSTPQSPQPSPTPPPTTTTNPPPQPPVQASPPVEPSPPLPSQSSAPQGPSFNPEDMPQQVKQTLQEGFAAAAATATERHSQLLSQPQSQSQPTAPSSSRPAIPTQVGGILPTTSQHPHRSRSKPRSRKSPTVDFLIVVRSAHIEPMGSTTILQDTLLTTKERVLSLYSRFLQTDEVQATTLRLRIVSVNGNDRLVSTHDLLSHDNLPPTTTRTTPGPILHPTVTQHPTTTPPSGNTMMTGTLGANGVLHAIRNLSPRGQHIRSTAPLTPGVILTSLHVQTHPPIALLQHPVPHQLQDHDHSLPTRLQVQNPRNLPNTRTNLTGTDTQLQPLKLLQAKSTSRSEMTIVKNGSLMSDMAFVTGIVRRRRQSSVMMSNLSLPNRWTEPNITQSMRGSSALIGAFQLGLQNRRQTFWQHPTFWKALMFRRSPFLNCHPPRLAL